MRRLGIFVPLAAVAGLASCTAGHKSPPGEVGSTTSGGAPPPIVITDVASAQANAGKQVEVRGTADDAKLGAEVSVGPLVVYCIGVDRWPAALAGKPVVARGLLESTTEFAEESDPNLPSAGTTGAVWVLRSCTFEPPR